MNNNTAPTANRKHERLVKAFLSPSKKEVLASNGFLSDNLRLIKLDLQSFWENFGGKENYGKGFTEEEKLQWLKDYSKKRFFFRTRSRERMRRKFNKPFKRFTKIFDKPCFVCSQPTDHRHHIIALVNGGDNRKINMVGLCKFHHTKVHPWLSNSESLGNVSLAL